MTAGADATLELAVVRGGEVPHTNKYGEKYRREPQPTYR